MSSRVWSWQASQTLYCLSHLALGGDFINAGIEEQNHGFAVLVEKGWIGDMGMTRRVRMVRGTHLFGNDKEGEDG